MAWLQSSFTSHQLLVDSNSNKKGSKNGCVSKHSNADKSNTPLLEDTSQSPESEVAPTDWLSSSSSTEKKQNQSSNSSKTSFLSHSLFDKGSKGKSPVSPNAPNARKKPPENKGLLSKENSKKNTLFNEDSDEADSDDEWYLPRMGQYQRVRSVTEY